MAHASSSPTDARAATSVAFAGGYSAGHLTPGFALAEQLKQSATPLSILFFGSPSGPEATLVVQQHYRFVPIQTHPFATKTWARRLKALLSVGPAFFQARRMLHQQRVEYLYVSGSHAALAPALAAWSLRIPFAVLETNYTFGLTNSLLARFAEQIYTSHLFSQSLSPRLAAKQQTVGLPLRHAVTQLHAYKPAYPTTDQPFTLLILGGSRGHPLLNRTLPGLWQSLSLGRPIHVIHQCGLGYDAGPISARYAESGISAEVHPYLDPITQAYQRAHLVITAAGAITLHELAVLGLPTILIPLPEAAARHQRENAQRFAAHTGCRLFASERWPQEEKAFKEHVTALILQPSYWQQQASRMPNFPVTDATSLVLEPLNQLAEHSRYSSRR